MTPFTEPGLGGVGGGGSGELKKPHPSVCVWGEGSSPWRCVECWADSDRSDCVKETPHLKHRQIIFNRKTTAWVYSPTLPVMSVPPGGLPRLTIWRSLVKQELQSSLSTAASGHLSRRSVGCTGAQGRSAQQITAALLQQKDIATKVEL